MEGNLRFSSGKEIYHFCFVLLCIRWQIPSTSPTGAYTRSGDLTEVFLRCDFGGLIFGILRYYSNFSDPEMLGFVN